jgi:putative transposase
VDLFAYEPIRQRLGQCGNGKLVLVAQDGATARKIYRTRNEARADVFDYIERFYNAPQRHSTIGYVSPVELERKLGSA